MIYLLLTLCLASTRLTTDSNTKDLFDLNKLVLILFYDVLDPEHDNYLTTFN
jgi:hypothetical protein